MIYNNFKGSVRDLRCALALGGRPTRHTNVRHGIIANTLLFDHQWHSLIACRLIWNANKSSVFLDAGRVILFQCWLRPSSFIVSRKDEPWFVSLAPKLAIRPEHRTEFRTSFIYQQRTVERQRNNNDGCNTSM